MNLFPGATFFIQKAAFDDALGPTPSQPGDIKYYDVLRTSKTVLLSGDVDLFGDGSLIALSTPGHTPGHQSLLVPLPKTGAVILGGDIAHTQENFALRRVPVFNADAIASKASMDKVARIMSEQHAQLWINHDVNQSSAMIRSPTPIE